MHKLVLSPKKILDIDVQKNRFFEATRLFKLKITTVDEDLKIDVNKKKHFFKKSCVVMPYYPLLYIEQWCNK